MSRGLGKTQRAILDFLASEPAGRHKKTGVPFHSSIAEVAAQVYGPAPTDAQLVATRRAVRRLAADGHLEVQRSTVELEQARRSPLATYVLQCAGDGCEWCAAEIPRYTGLWANENPPERYLDWDPSRVVERYVKDGEAWHCGKMRPRRKTGEYNRDAVSAVILRRLLTDEERQAEAAHRVELFASLRAIDKGIGS